MINPSMPETTLEVPRRTLVKGAVWSMPVIAAAAVVPSSTASVNPLPHVIDGSLGVGWYPDVPGSTTSGALQFDSVTSDHYFRILGTSFGERILSIYLHVLISTSWPSLTFTPLPGSDPAWGNLGATGTTMVYKGVTYALYRAVRSGSTIVATGNIVDVPTNYAFRALTPYYAAALVQTRLSATVNGDSVFLEPEPAAVVNTNVPVSQAPMPT